MDFRKETTMLSVFQVSTLLMVSLTSLILAGAEEFPLAALTVPIAVSTWWFVDRMGRILMPAWLGTLLAMGALGLAFFEYNYFTNQSLLAVGGHMLTYLIWTFLFQSKAGRQYWWLMALCLLQVAVAAMLNYSIWFGIGLLVYALLAIWTLSVFLLYSSTASIKKNAGEETDVIRDPPSATSPIGQVWNNVALGPQTQLLTWNFTGNIFFIFIQTFLIAALFFLLIPRIWANTSFVSNLGRTNRPVTGFSNDVRLGDLGEILEDDKEVMSVRVFRGESTNPLGARDLNKFFGREPLFRGGVLEKYQDGRWTHETSQMAQRLRYRGESYQYRILFDLKPLGTDTVFTFGDMVAAESESEPNDLTLGIFSQEVRRGRNAPNNQPFRYLEYANDGPPDTTLYAAREARRLERESRGSGSNGSESIAEEALKRYLNLLKSVPARCEALGPIADKVVKGARTPEEVARKLESWFKDSEEFGYTTRLKVTDPNIDPIVDFITNRKSGHCEYFAAGLAMMLRTQGIPSRVITGFKGGLIPPNSNVLRIQQLHAHAWVEAYFDGRWVTYDPTPPIRDQTVHEIEGLTSNWFGLWLGAETAWVKIAGLSQETQDTRIYAPLRKIGTQLAMTAQLLREGNFHILERIKAIILNRDRWFSWEGGVLAAVVMLVGSGLVWLVRWLWRSMSRWGNMAGGNEDALARARRLVPFYERFMALLRAEGLEQRPNQTAREFVDASWKRLQPRLGAMEGDGWPEEIVEAFYQVRFGGMTTEALDMNRLNQHLQQIEASLQAARESREKVV